MSTAVMLFLVLPGSALYIGLLVASMRSGRGNREGQSDRLFCPDTGEPLPLAELPPDTPVFDQQTGRPFVDDQPTGLLARVDEPGLVVHPDVAD